MMRKKLADVLRDAIRNCKLNLTALAELCGVSQPTLWAFMRGDDMRLETAEKVAAFLGLSLAKKA